MNNDKFFKLSVLFVFLAFTIYQIFYFGSVDSIFVSVIDKEVLISIFLYLAQTVVLIGLAILGIYILPLVCVLELSTLFIHLKQINVVIVPNNDYINTDKPLNTNNLYRKLQVIRC